MNTLKNAADIIKNILGNRNNLLILAFIGVLVLILAMPSGESKEETSYTAKKESENEQDELETRLERILKNTEGVGEVRVMITGKEEGESFTKEESGENDVEGVVVVAEGAENPNVKKKIQDIVLALFPIEAHKIEIVKMKAE